MRPRQPFLGAARCCHTGTPVLGRGSARDTGWVTERLCTLCICLVQLGSHTQQPVPWETTRPFDQHMQGSCFSLALGWSVAGKDVAGLGRVSEWWVAGRSAQVATPPLFFTLFLSCLLEALIFGEFTITCFVSFITAMVTSTKQ